MSERPAVVCTDGFEGRREHPVVVVGETPKKYRVRLNLDHAQRIGRSIRYPGENFLVPKGAVRLTTK